MPVTTYRPLGRTGVLVSPLALGCMLWGKATPEADAFAIMDRYAEEGGNFFDTADVYGQGESELVIGRYFRARPGLRERVVLASKFHWQMGDAAVYPNRRGNSAYHIVSACEASLRRLGLDHIDLYQVHRPVSSVPIDETLGALDRLVKAGKVVYLGTTTFAAWQLTEAWYVARELGYARFVSEQPPYNLLDRRIERELLPFCRTYGVGVIPWSPIGGGLLSGKYSSRTPEPPDARFTRPENKNHPWAKRKTAECLAIADAVIALAAERGCTPSQLALAWVASRAGVTAPIIGPRTMAQLEDNLGALSLTLTEADHARLDAVVAPGDHVSPYYEADFGPSPYRL
ncbi:MAG: aldo/keto reductase [Phycisphaerales bacterium]|nr:aldo/keto reductase [Phycisphaerales bacterium]